MKQKEFEFKAFLIESYSKMWVTFTLLLVVIIVIPGMLLANYFLPEDTVGTSLISQLLILSLIAVPLMILLFAVINGLFFKKITIYLEEPLKIKKSEKLLYEFEEKEVTKIMIKSNDDKSIQNRFRTLEITTKKNKKVKIISRDNNQEGVFDDFINAFVSHYGLNKSEGKKVSINTLGDYKLIFDQIN